MSHLQNLLLDTLLGTKHVDSAALIKLQERSHCVTSPGFSEKDYKCVRSDDSSLYAKNENTGVVVVKTRMYLLVATYTAGMYPSVCVEATEKLDKQGKHMQFYFGSDNFHNLKCH
ncbi:hypothetical protein A6R68_13403 [Neotoma lepida]|uniref:Profilin n=1 Tax=Neotoma lepida TaxID=56216 RepID=A0A1A6H0B1_NEOLE|nr:hypothetical protein A6R68_13403 [Neotoma lepida]